MSTLTIEQQQSIANKLASIETIPAGLGNEEAACSIAAINLALTGELTDQIPDCMSEVIGRWIIRTQDEMPASLRNSSEWRELLPLAAGTGRELERERLSILLDHMWSVSLAFVQPLADRHGFGDEWRLMCSERSVAAANDAAYTASRAAHAAYAAAGRDAWETINPVGLLRQLIEVEA
jgi:hypothetical protein